jgi:hypothetical protein
MGNNENSLDMVRIQAVFVIPAFLIATTICHGPHESRRRAAPAVSEEIILTKH